MRCSKGAGGQHRDKASSAIRVVHEPSGASGFCQDYREQHRNKKTAFLRMVETTKFQAWLKIKILDFLGQPTVDEVVDRQMHESNLRVEGKNSKGKWSSLDGSEDQ